MLSLLRIENLVIVKTAELSFSLGLNVVTGETGAGKSMLLKALELISGARAGADLIRSGEDRCTVEGQFIISAELRERLLTEVPWFEELAADDELIVRRSVERSGRGRISINGRLASAGELQHLASYLIDITAQHQQRYLLDPAAHLDFLDIYAQNGALLEKVRTAYSQWREARERLQLFLADSAAQKDLLRRLEFEAQELREAKLRVGERHELEQELKRLSGLEGLLQSTAELTNILEDNENGMERLLRKMRAALDRVIKLDPSAQNLSEIFESAAVSIDDFSAQLANYASELEIDPERNESLRERLSDIARLERKYGRDETGLVTYRDEILAQLAENGADLFNEEKLREQVEISRAALTALEEELRKSRERASRSLESGVGNELGAVGMKQAKFKVELEVAESGPKGADSCTFLLAANPGEPPRALNKVASGGELSRVLLVLKTVLNENRGASLQVFDEIDAGIGGGIAQVVGEKIKQLTPRYQVLLVTHAPQIAAFADQHLYIWKESDGKSTETRVRTLATDERLDEVARMLAGKDVSAEFKKSAQALISSALGVQNLKNKPKSQRKSA